MAKPFWEKLGYETLDAISISARHGGKPCPIYKWDGGYTAAMREAMEGETLVCYVAARAPHGAQALPQQLSVL
jgi:hypothetical protein